MNSDTRRQLHKLVWDWRDQYGKIYPTPERIDSAHFFLEEYTEALDAYLRTNGKYMRNNDKDLNFKKELGDCAFMLITALEKEYNQNWDNWQTNLSGARALGIEVIGIHVLKSWLWIVETPSSRDVADNEIWKAISAIQIYTGGIEKLVQEKLEYLYLRHVAPGER